MPLGLQGVGFSEPPVVPEVSADVPSPGGAETNTPAGHHISLLAETQVITAGGGLITWTLDSTEPALRKGFNYVALPTTDITVDLTGFLSLEFEALWRSYRGGGDILIHRIRNGQSKIRAYGGGLTPSRALGGTFMGMEVQGGDIIRMELPNKSGDGASLLAAELSIVLINGLH